MSNNIETKRHSFAHVLARAVLTLYPEAKLGMGPAIENGFYYDFDFPEPLSVDALSRIENEMKEIMGQEEDFAHSTVTVEKAKEMFAAQPFKTELIDDLEKEAGGEELGIYSFGDFVDLCKGPHVENSSELNKDAFKLTRIAGVYWKSNENNKQLQRIYGVAFDTPEELKKHLHQVEEAKKRDHRRLGKELDLFSFHPEAPGMPFWHAKGKIIFETLVKRWRSIQNKYGYEELSLPNIMDVSLWKRSGHYDHFKDDMFFTQNEGRQMALRPMDCPGAIMVYGEKLRSYNDLPLKWSELGTVFRNEKSGELHGLMRVQQITQDDAHIFAPVEKISEQVEEVMKIMEEIYKPFDMEREIYLSTKPDKAMGSDEIWQTAESALRQALDKSGIKYGIKEKDGAFYGPKIDVHIKDSLGRSWQTGTIQLDFFMPEKFDISFVGNDGAPQRPIIIHRALMGSLERFIGILTEHYAGDFPLWLAPVQVSVVAISDKHNEYVQDLERELKEAGVRVVSDTSNETLGKKIRASELQKVPYTVVVGDKEVETNELAVRSRHGDKKNLKLSEFIELIKKEQEV